MCGHVPPSLSVPRSRFDGSEGGTVFGLSEECARCFLQRRHHLISVAAPGDLWAPSRPLHFVLLALPLIGGSSHNTFRACSFLLPLASPFRQLRPSKEKGERRNTKRGPLRANLCTPHSVCLVLSYSQDNREVSPPCRPGNRMACAGFTAPSCLPGPGPGFSICAHRIHCYSRTPCGF